VSPFVSVTINGFRDLLEQLKFYTSTAFEGFNLAGAGGGYQASNSCTLRKTIRTREGAHTSRGKRRYSSWWPIKITY